MNGTPPSDSDSLSFPKIDTTVPHSARIYDYWLGGKDNYPADREMGEQIRAVLPSIVEMARDQRAFLARVVRYLAGEAGIRQFLDIGTGLPTADNTHQVAQQVAPESRIVYVDNDPLVLAHARALLTSSPEGTRSCGAPPRRWTLANPSRSCCWGSCTTSPIPTRRTRS